MLLEELGRSEELEAILRRTSERLSSAGYAQQVPVLEGGVNLFLEGAGGRERLYREGDGFRLRTSGVHVTLRDVKECQAEDHLVLSPNVLSRPVVESSVFPTLSYVGGPGEIAYFAQLGEYFRAHGLEMPIVYPRCSVTLVEKKIRKILDKFELSLEFLQKPFHEVASEVAREGVPQEVGLAMQGFRESVAKCTEELGQAVNSIDPTLNAGAAQVRSQAFSALEELERKILQAIKRENQIGLNQLEKAQLHLYPDGKPAERVQNPFYFLARYGGAFLEELYNSFEVSI
jgi:bacillithiol biosynthesis cysteine-adding enzyme BshC